MNTDEDQSETVCPYFLSEVVDFSALPKSVQAAFTTIVIPAYNELVLAAPNALERSMGASFVFLLTEEVLSHFELGRGMNLSQTQTSAEHDKRQQEFGRYLKLLGAKSAVLNALVRLRKLPTFRHFTPIVPPVTQA